MELNDKIFVVQRIDDDKVTVKESGGNGKPKEFEKNQLCLKRTRAQESASECWGDWGQGALAEDGSLFCAPCNANSILRIAKNEAGIVKADCIDITGSAFRGIGLMNKLHWPKVHHREE